MSAPTGAAPEQSATPEERDLARVIIHVDMDAFYASVEQHDHPELRGKAVIIGGSPQSRGVVSTASYEARKFGVHSAMPTAHAYRLCPHGIFLPVNMARYMEVSRVIHAIFRDFTPLVMPLSCDEAFLDVTGSQRLFGTPLAIGRLLKHRIKDTTGLTASVGIASTLFVAKVASDLEKPDGLTLIPDAQVVARLAPLPVRAVWGVGKVAEKHLARLGILTIADLQRWELKELREHFGDFGEHLHQLCRGIDPRTVEAEQAAEKSISNEHTFDRDLTSRDELERALLYLSDKVGRRAREAQMPGRTVQLKLKYADFTSVTRRQTLPEPTASGQEIFCIARQLLREKTEAGRRAVRLIGVGVSGFTDAVEATTAQGCLFDATPPEEPNQQTAIKKMARAEAAADEILKKLGHNAIGRGSLLLDDDPRESKRKNDNGRP